MHKEYHHKFEPASSEINMKKLAAVALLSVVTVSVSANEGLYAGVSYLSTKLDSGISNLVDAGNDGTLSLDEDDSGWKVFIGMPVNDNLSVEAHYADLGEFVIKSSLNDDFDYLGSTWTQTGVNQTDSYGFKSIGVGLVLGMDINQHVRPFAKVGMHRWSGHVSKDLGASLSYEKDHEFDPFYGVGVDVSVTDQFSVRASYEQYDMFYDTEVLSLGLLAKF